MSSRFSTQWTTTEVVSKLESLGLGAYSQAFLQNNISGEVLPYLNEDHLRELGMKSLGHRFILLQFIKKLPRQYDLSAQPQAAIEPKDQPEPEPEQHKPRQMKSSDSLSRTAVRQAAIPSQSPDREPIQRPSSTDEDKAAPPLSTWEKKRRQMILQRQQMMQQQQQQPSSDFSQPKSKPTAKAPPTETKYSSSEDEEPAFSQQTATIKRKPQFREDDSDEKPRSKKQTPEAYDRDEEEPPKPAFRKPIMSDANNDLQNTPPMDSGSGGADKRVACAYCGRKFDPERLEKHEQICARSSTHKAKVFDSKARRLEGTEAAKYQGGSKDEAPKKNAASGVPKFKAEHEKLVATLRYARKETKYENDKKEGKDAGPPPEAPPGIDEQEDDTRVTCPYCGRKFGEKSASMHIQTCERINGGRGRGRGAPMGRTTRGRR